MSRHHTIKVLILLWWIFIQMIIFHHKHKNVNIEKMNFHHMITFHHKHKQSLQLWTLTLYPMLDTKINFISTKIFSSTLWILFARKKNLVHWQIFNTFTFYQNNCQFSTYWHFNSIMTFHCNGKCSSQWSIFITIMNFHNKDEILPRWTIFLDSS